VYSISRHGHVQPGRLSSVDVARVVGRAGILPEGDTMDIKRADVAAAREAIEHNRDMIAGVKARLCCLDC
jgi:hypothetical protein